MSKRREIATPAKRVSELEGQLPRMARILGGAEPVLRDAHHLAERAEHADRLHRSTESKLRDLPARTAPLGIGKPRFTIAVDTVYFADAPGYVSMVFFSERTGPVQILAGPDDPPTEPVSFRGDQYVGGFIRSGEYWKVETFRPADPASFDGIFTPLY